MVAASSVLPGILQKHCCILPDRNTVKKLDSSGMSHGCHVVCFLLFSYFRNSVAAYPEEDAHIFRCLSLSWS
ncbi:Hypothetical predicted protein [Lynx pardinus]|uniref:Uncharacterized protein n=1 Tax=Lynx pardinus TaxID=191816 RepID=A0A485NDN0_LYNPA|nr:Hypothetical predicted protein [Lynx pardinus]